MTSLRLLADDLTGALDTAAEFAGLCGPFDVTWADALPARLPPCLAIDSGTRERNPSDSVAIVERLAPLLGEAAIAYKKVDSLLRGAWAAELAATLRAGPWRACIVAPAFPHQGRRTRNAQQYGLTPDGRWTAVGGNLLAQLAGEGIDAQTGRFDAALTDGVHVFDVESDADLARVAAIGRQAPFPVLWCGSGGLAGALARGQSAVAPATLRTPVLGLFGSDQAATAAQLKACGSAVVTVKEAADHAALVRHKLMHDDVALVRFALPPDISRSGAAERIARELNVLTAALDAPGTLIVSGGETLKAVCLAVGARALKVTGRIVPGLPRSRLKGGRWTGVEIISKSGAFGAADLWQRLLRDNHLLIERNAS